MGRQMRNVRRRNRPQTGAMLTSLRTAFSIWFTQPQQQTARKSLASNCETKGIHAARHLRSGRIDRPGTNRAGGNLRVWSAFLEARDRLDGRWFHQFTAR